MAQSARSFPPALATNRLLAMLPAEEACLLAQDCEPVVLAAGERLHVRGEPLDAVIFPTAGFVSLRARVDERPSLEVAQVGREGMIGLPLLLNVPVAIADAIVEGAGSGLRVPAEAFGCLLGSCPTLRCRLEQYACVFASQLARSVACAGHHPVLARLARWLLGTQERAGTLSIRMTQDALARTLGVRRAAITEAACVLQSRALIRYRRGTIEFVDRGGLEAVSCSCHAAECRDWARIMAPASPERHAQGRPMPSTGPPLNRPMPPSPSSPV